MNMIRHETLGENFNSESLGFFPYILQIKASVFLAMKNI